MASSTRQPARPGERGAITWVTALLLAALVSGGYLVYVWGPIWIVQYEAKQVVRDYGNRAIKDTRDDEELQAMCRKLQSLDSDLVAAPDGGTERRPAVDVQPQDVTWERDMDSTPPTLHVAFSYERPLHYPVLDVWRDVTMQVDLTLDLSRADWGPAR